MTKNRTRTPVYLDPGMHPGLEVKGLTIIFLVSSIYEECMNNDGDIVWIASIHVHTIILSFKMFFSYIYFECIIKHPKSKPHISGISICQQWFLNINKILINA